MSRQTLDAAGYEHHAPAVHLYSDGLHRLGLERIAPEPESFAFFDDFIPMSYSGDGDVEAEVTAVDINLAGDRASTSGCEEADFAGFPIGDIALIQRGSCDFRVKADFAEAAGASAVIIFNQGNVDPLGRPVRRR